MTAARRKIVGRMKTSEVQDLVLESFRLLAKERELGAENIQQPFTCADANLNTRMDGELLASGPFYRPGDEVI